MSSDKSDAKRPGKKQRQATPEQKVRSLSIEISSLSQKMKSVPKFSPEWTLSKVEMKLVYDELNYICEKSMRSLSVEISNLSRKMNSLPKLSPEWKLSKLMMKLIIDELEHFHAESIAIGTRACILDGENPNSLAYN